MTIFSRYFSLIGDGRLGVARLLGCAVFAALPWSAHATLGGDTASVTTDRTAMQATATSSASTRALSTATSTSTTAATSSTSTTSSGNYTVSSLVTPQGTTIHEYLSTDGKVFAVAWSGPAMPDLQQLFGNYFTDFKEAASNAVATSGGRGPLLVQTGQLVVHSGGMMRALHGIAYLKDSLPSGFSVDSIQ